MNFQLLILFSFTFVLLSCEEEQIINNDDNTLIADSTDGIPNVFISESMYDDNSSYYSIDTAYFENDILNVKIASGGCSGDSWEVSLIDQGVVMESYPEQRNIKILFKNEELCKAYIYKDYQFNIAKLKLSETGKIYLKLKDYKGSLLYEY